MDQEKPAKQPSAVGATLLKQSKPVFKTDQYQSYSYGGRAGGIFRIPVSDKLNLTGSTQLRFRSARTTLFLLALLFAIILTAVLLTWRLEKLEGRVTCVELELEEVRIKLDCVLTKLAVLERTMAVSPEEVKKGCHFDYEQSYLDEEEDDDGEEVVRVKRVKRSPDPGLANNRFRQSSSIEDSFTAMTNNSLGNGYRGPGPVDPSVIKRGNTNTTSPTRQSRRHIVNQLWRLRRSKDRDQRSLAKLKMKLETSRNNAKSAKVLVSAYRQRVRERDLQVQNDGVRAVYLTIRDPAIKLHPKQLIGPWHMPDSGEDLGFSSHWYKNLSLDNNRTSVIFQENGLYLIYAQVYYKNPISKTDKTNGPMGYKIYIRKNQKESEHRGESVMRPIPIAECVPAFPKTLFQTCFTQICWYVEKGDEIFLEHFTESHPIIEAGNMGQTFLGIVRLSQ